jgi:spore maturation protein CgeB
MKIDFLITDNEYDTAAYFSQHFAAALKKEGVECRLFWIGGGNFYKAYYEITQDPPDLTCSFSDITLGDNELLCEAWQIPHLSLFVDHAIYFLHQLKSKYSLVSCIDSEDVDFLRKMNFERCLFLPHATPKHLFQENREEKIYDMVMLGSCVDVEKIEKKFPKKLKTLMQELSEKVLKSNSTSCLQALIDAGITQDLPLLHRLLESYVRGKDRLQLLETLKEFDVHIWGQGPWKKYAPKAHLHRPVSFERGLEVMKRAKIVMNSVPSLKFGGHERIFHALALGALPLTSSTTFIHEQFEEGKSILTYRYGHQEQTAACVRDILQDDEKRSKIIHAGQDIVRASHTWETRAKTLLSFLKGLTTEDTEKEKILSVDMCF